jgi:endoglucanase
MPYFEVFLKLSHPISVFGGGLLAWIFQAQKGNAMIKDFLQTIRTGPPSSWDNQMFFLGRLATVPWLTITTLALAAPALATDETVRSCLPFGTHFTLGEVAVTLPAEASGQFVTTVVAPGMAPPAMAWPFLTVDLQGEPLADYAYPRVSHAYLVDPSILALDITDGRVVRGQQVPYVPAPNHRQMNNGWVKQNGEILGYLVETDPPLLRTVDQRLGQPLDTNWADRPASYRIRSEQDGAYADGRQPTAVFRKTKPTKMAEVGPNQLDWSLRHTIYLQLPTPLTTGQTYRVEFDGQQLVDVTLTYDPTHLRSEAVQVSQVGFAPNDPTKVAFLGTWMGNGGPLDYSPELTFSVVNQATDETVYTGRVERSHGKDEPEDNRDRNYTGTDVYLMDFSSVTAPGRYRVVVAGIGTSYPFDIQPQVWDDAFYVSVRGLFHQRSGIALGPPYTDYRRPRPFHPDDGVEVYQSTVPLMDTSMGLNREVDAFDVLQETRTDELLPDAWGGWFDAGDWDRRIQHLQVTRLLLELAILFPDFAAQTHLNLPESDNALPDVVDEALWGLDVFKRLQMPDGAIRGGIESAKHPNKYEASWQESLTVMAYGPGIWSSYQYAGTAARAAYALQDRQPKLAQDYATSALAAMEWAEAAWAKGEGQDDADVKDSRNLAAAELYRLTGDDTWHRLFLDTTVFADPEAPVALWKSHDQAEAAFVYTQTPQPEVEAQVQQNARNALIREADGQRQAMANTAYRWNKHPGAPMGWGTALGGLKLTDLLRAHALTGDEKYLQSAILAAQFALGANPDNMVYTTGLGYRSPQDPLIVDIRATGQSPPPGITVYGPLDLIWRSDYWAVNLFKDVTSPSPWEWPTVESYFDVFSYVPVTEFTVMQTIGPTAYGLGYLAALQGADE